MSIAGIFVLMDGWLYYYYYYPYYCYYYYYYYIGGMLGVGGGAVMVPALSLLTDLEYKMILGTSLSGISTTFSLL